MKRIGFLTDSIFSFGGVQRVTAVIAKELARDYDVTIVTLDKPEQEDTSLYNLQEADIHYRFFQYPETPRWKQLICKTYSYLYRKILPQTKITSNLYAYSSYPSEKRDALVKELIAGEYNVIIGVHAPLSVRLAAYRSKLGNIKLIGWIHNSYEALFGTGSLYIGPELRKHYEYQLQKLDKTVVLCQDDAHKYHFPTEIIYNPLTLEPGKPSQGDSKRFLAVGRFSHRHKGFDLLIEAFNIFAKDNKEWVLDIVGEGVEEPLYRKMIADYQLEERIALHPFTNNIQEYYSQAQVYILSSRWEGFGLVLVEAMAHGLPIVSSDLPTSKEIMGDFAIYFKNGNINDLARSLKDATEIDWERKSKEALTIAKRFDITTISNQWRKLIDE
ncbi:glycosyltransferase [Prevotella communis]|uniref:glycosyltransferase n=1 Tax=Prevotella communis TaxID=2913614 RepID=UPI001EDB2635|nr:glycosyltransferase [Prevotella communis]UKK63112.1 glycosyltransferase [Prevotella communis]UKK65937.1 glycosyltransferase [Prevotella communis]